MNTLPEAIVYTETVVHTAPERYVTEAPYQIAIVDIPEVGRKTVRILGEYVTIGESVRFEAYRDEVPCYQRSSDSKISHPSNK